MREEFFKPAPGYPSYQISEKGNVRSCSSGKVLKYERASGPACVFIYVPKSKLIYVHELVAIAFIPNPHNYRNLVHVDGNINNPSADNLVWSDTEGIEVKTVPKPVVVLAAKRSKSIVRCIDTNETFKNQTEAAKHFNMDPTSVSESIRFGRKARGHLFIKEEIL